MITKRAICSRGGEHGRRDYGWLGDLGLGDIGPEAGMPVMEGKCVLFKEFAGVDAFPLCVRTKDVDELVRTIYLISGSFGGINLEDIAAPRCFEVERKLKEICRHSRLPRRPARDGGCRCRRRCSTR